MSHRLGAALLLLLAGSHLLAAAEGDLCSTFEALSIANPQDDSVFNDVSLSLHRNGETNVCGQVDLSVAAIQTALQATGELCNLHDADKFQTETFLTNLFAAQLAADKNCGSTDNVTAAPEGFLGFCDMSEKRLVLQSDTDKLVKTSSESLPCRFFTREGRRIYSLQHLAKLVDSAVQTAECKADGSCTERPSVHLYAVPAGRVFMFAPSFVGERFVLDHVQETGSEHQIVLEVINVNPRVFEIHHFFTHEEAQAMIDKALSETSETHKMHRSTTGATKGSVFNKRTSENAWLTNGQPATKIKRRCMEVLGFDEYWESHTDGLQVLRYQNAQAYTPHADYLTDQGTENYNYDTSGKGGNRFATILLYMTDLEASDGGETLFKHAWPPGVAEADRISHKTALETLRASGASGEGSILEQGSWEEEMTAYCRSRLSIRPQRGRAVLFYSQHPNGKEDTTVLHGGCPVLNGTKWAANLWVWNAARNEFPHAPRKREESEEEKEKRNPKGPVSIPVSFTNSGKDPQFNEAKLFYQTTDFGDLKPGSPPIRVNTYASHEWSVKVGDQVLKTIVIKNGDKQFIL